ARRLDALLVRAARANNASRRHFAFDCDVGVTELERARRHVAFVCVTPSLALQPPARFDGALIVHGTQVESGSIDRMILTEPGVDVEALRNIAIAGGSIVTAHGGVTATFRIARDGAHVRGGDGNAVERVRLHWSGPASDVSMQSKKTRVARGVAAVTIVEDFAPILEAVAALQRDTLNGTSDALSAQPFRRASVLAAIYRRLGLASSRWCCVDDAKMASPQATETVRMAAMEDGSALSVP